MPYLDLSKIRVADMIAFADKNLISLAIQLGARGKVSHVASVKRVDEYGHITLQEPTTANFGRIIETDLQERIMKSGKNTRIYWFQLSDESRSRLDVQKYVECLEWTLGDRYSIWKALWSAFGLVTNQENRGGSFCSEDYSRALKASGVLNHLWNTSEVNPPDLTKTKLWAQYTQLIGPIVCIDGFNSVGLDDMAHLSNIRKLKRLGLRK